MSNGARGVQISTQKQKKYSKNLEIIGIFLLTPAEGQSMLIYTNG
jgi:hypothetical protein